VYPEVGPVVHLAQRLQVARRLDPLLELVVVVQVQSERGVDLVQVHPVGLGVLDV
jgi:hypothetical protein